jgi:uncharacterized membrane protein YeiH
MMLFVEVAAVISGAIFGVLLARRKQMDFVGVFSVAFMTAFGSGTLRDVLLDRHPLFWIQYSWYPVVVFVVAAVASLIPRIPGWVEKFLYFPDALGLGLFSILGAEIAMEEGTASFVAILFGVITGTFGGVIGEIACNDIPSLFRPATPLYATCAFAGACVFSIGKSLALPTTLTFVVSAAIVVLMRLTAIRFHICLRAIERRPDS